MKTVLTIAGADPSGGAGIQADLKAFSWFGVRGLSAITALTAQNNTRVESVLPVSPEFLRKQVLVLLEEFRIDAVKIGMIGSLENLNSIKKLLRENRFKSVVLDTVLRSTGGFPLIDKKGVRALRSLLPLVRVVTPNLDEASIIAGTEDITGIDGMEEAARKIHSYGAPYVLVKGGHLSGKPVDVLYDGRSFRRFTGQRIRGKAARFHGTGCMLSAGVAAGLSTGKPMEEAVEGAKAYVAGVLKGRSQGV